MSEIAPHDCPACGASAFVGFTGVECVNPGCRLHHAETAKAHWAESDPEDDIDTLPALKPVTLSFAGDQLISYDSNTSWVSVGGSTVSPFQDDDIKRIKDAVTQGILDLLDGKKSD